MTDFFDQLARAGVVPWMFATGVGVAFALMAWGLAAASGTLLSPLRRRLRALRDPAADEPAAVMRPAGSGNMWWNWFEPKATESRSRERTRLMQAGLRADPALGILYLARLLLAVGVPLVLLVADAASGSAMPGGAVLMGLPLAALIGFSLPGYLLNLRVRRRQATLMEGLPDALDLLVACTEAGLSLNAAIERVAQQMPASQPELAGELSMVNVEIRAGLERTVALKNLAERTGLEEIRGLVSLISHSMRLGTGIAGTLRIYAEEFRDRRMQRAEEMAATVGTQLIFPLVLLLFPSFFLISVGPAIMSVIRVLAATPLPGN